MTNPCIFCGLNKPLTLEHIIPEAIGGRITTRSVCTDCNSEMGAGFEGSALKSILLDGPRYAHGISGKTGSPKHPFAKVGKYEDGSLVRLNERMEPYLIPKISDEVKEDGTTVISITLDKSDEKNAELIIRKKLGRIYRKQHPDISDSDLEDLLTKATDAAMKSASYGSIDASVKMKTASDIRGLRLLFLKIAYEISFYHFGDDYLADPMATKLCQCINTRSACEDIHGQVPVNDPERFYFAARKDCHSIILLGSACIIRLFDLVGMVEFTEIGSQFELSQEDAVCFFNSYTEGSSEKIKFLDWINEIAGP